MKVDEFVPALTPLTFHWNEGVDPPLIGMAVKVTDDPGQKGLEDAVMLIPACKPVLTTIVIELDVAGLLIGQAIFEVKSHKTISPLLGE